MFCVCVIRVVMKTSWKSYPPYNIFVTSKAFIDAKLVIEVVESPFFTKEQNTHVNLLLLYMMTMALITIIKDLPQLVLKHN